MISLINNNFRIIKIKMYLTSVTASMQSATSVLLISTEHDSSHIFSILCPSSRMITSSYYNDE